MRCGAGSRPARRTRVCCRWVRCWRPWRRLPAAATRPGRWSCLPAKEAPWRCTPTARALARRT
eukprot:5268316-Lingulodinium_polyedra.AAC.1